MNRAVLLDRDGTLNAEVGYIGRPEQLILIDGAAQAVADLCAAGWQVIVFTNQSGIGRGLYSEADLAAVHTKLTAEIEAAGGRLSGIYFCPHAPDFGCDCRKPLPGLLHQAAREHDLDLTQCIVVGDSQRDMEAGQAVGCRTILVLTGHTTAEQATEFSPPPDAVFPNLAAAVAALI
jgi:D-glycero-D-manno-heptose 1,7-bisphosphate phosphatase